MNNEDVANYVLSVIKPVNVMLIERVGRFRIMRKYHPFVHGLVLLLLLSVVGLPWVVIGISEGPNPAITYILGYVAVANALYSSLMGTYVLYSRAKTRLDQIVRHLSLKLPPLGMNKWQEVFSTRAQFATSLTVAVLVGSLVGLTTVITDKVDSITIASATLGGYVTGFFIGNGIHLFIHFPSTASLFFLINIRKIYKLAPVETSGLTYLFGITLDFMLIGSSVGTFALSTLILYLSNANLYTASGYLPAIVAAVFIVIVAVIMLIRSVVIFTNRIRQEKLQVLSNLQDLINEKYDQLGKDKNKSEIYEKIEKLTKLYSSVKSSSSWPFEAEVARNSLISFLVPFLPALAQIAIGSIFP